MKKTDYYAVIFLLLVCCFGAWINGFWGGCIFGAGLVMDVTFFVGKWQIKKLAAIMDKQLTDKYFENESRNYTGEGEDLEGSE